MSDPLGMDPRAEVAEVPFFMAEPRSDLLQDIRQKTHSQTEIERSRLTQEIHAYYGNLGAYYYGLQGVEPTERDLAIETLLESGLDAPEGEHTENLATPFERANAKKLGFFLSVLLSAGEEIVSQLAKREILKELMALEAAKQQSFIQKTLNAYPLLCEHQYLFIFETALQRAFPETEDRALSEAHHKQRETLREAMLQGSKIQQDFSMEYLAMAARAQNQIREGGPLWAYACEFDLIPKTSRKKLLVPKESQPESPVAQPNLQRRLWELDPSPFEPESIEKLKQLDALSLETLASLSYEGLQELCDLLYDLQIILEAFRQDDPVLMQKWEDSLAQVLYLILQNFDPVEATQAPSALKARYMTISEETPYEVRMHSLPECFVADGMAPEVAKIMVQALFKSLTDFKTSETSQLEQEKQLAKKVEKESGQASLPPLLTVEPPLTPPVVMPAVIPTPQTDPMKSYQEMVKVTEGGINASETMVLQPSPAPAVLLPENRSLGSEVEKRKAKGGQNRSGIVTQEVSSKFAFAPPPPLTEEEADLHEVYWGRLTQNYISSQWERRHGEAKYPPLTVTVFGEQVEMSPYSFFLPKQELLVCRPDNSGDKQPISNYFRWTLPEDLYQNMVLGVSKQDPQRTKAGLVLGPAYEVHENFLRHKLPAPFDTNEWAVIFDLAEGGQVMLFPEHPPLLQGDLVHITGRSSFDGEDDEAANIDIVCTILSPLLRASEWLRTTYPEWDGYLLRDPEFKRGHWELISGRFSGRTFKGRTLLIEKIDRQALRRFWQSIQQTPAARLVPPGREQYGIGEMKYLQVVPEDEAGNQTPALIESFVWAKEVAGKPCYLTPRMTWKTKRGDIIQRIALLAPVAMASETRWSLELYEKIQQSWYLLDKENQTMLPANTYLQDFFEHQVPDANQLPLSDFQRLFRVHEVKDMLTGESKDEAIRFNLVEDGDLISQFADPSWQTIQKQLSNIDLIRYLNAMGGNPLMQAPSSDVLWTLMSDDYRSLWANLHDSGFEDHIFGLFLNQLEVRAKALPAIWREYQSQNLRHQEPLNQLYTLIDTFQKHSVAIPQDIVPDNISKTLVADAWNKLFKKLFEDLSAKVFTQEVPLPETYQSLVKDLHSLKVPKPQTGLPQIQLTHSFRQKSIVSARKHDHVAEADGQKVQRTNETWLHLHLTISNQAGDTILLHTKKRQDDALELVHCTGTSRHNTLVRQIKHPESGEVRQLAYTLPQHLEASVQICGMGFLSLMYTPQLGDYFNGKLSTSDFGGSKFTVLPLLKSLQSLAIALEKQHVKEFLKQQRH